ncbi:unnamed protein product [Rhizopus stolonifer]
MKFHSLILCTLLLLCFGLCTSQPVAERGLTSKLIKAVKSVLYRGKATIFDPVTEGGSQGACGQYSNKHSRIAAMNAHDYGDMNKKSHWCGKKIEITYKGKKTHATVTDACPGCDKGCLDLTQAVWGDLESDFGIGIIDVTWKLIED